MVAKRIAAVFAAVLLIVGAVLFRRQLDDDNDASPAGPDVTNPTSSPDRGATIVCIPDLRAICEAIDADNDEFEVRVEDWSLTVEAMAAGQIPDGWITIAPLATFGAFDTVEPAASTNMQLVVRAERADALLTTCGAEPLWSCVGGRAGDQWSDLGGQANWGKVLPGFADPTTSAFGAAEFANASVSFFAGAANGPDDPETFTGADIDASDDYPGWFSRLAGNVPAAALADPLNLLLQRQSAVNVVATTGAQLSQIPDARVSELRNIDLAPPGRIDVVIAGTSGRFNIADVRLLVATALIEVGWDKAGTGADGIPSGQTLVLLSNKWQGER